MIMIITEKSLAHSLHSKSIAKHNVEQNKSQNIAGMHIK